ncbi:hypothetical protein NEOLEDRAFT_717226 [Neolentinus lepideus HHB14362 ss-1]|uniref:Uncharacterized protein n=1 Tax=Neolentinus lepideus HHB14362 ss-1 TaxID=1314782 RepID=A0A165Q504_9AGAM|nr:hypothetical protein NEOLEDRAFT_717226 [Neolentinus lepideus HHB14362 ss-1]
MRQSVLHCVSSKDMSTVSHPGLSACPRKTVLMPGHERSCFEKLVLSAHYKYHNADRNPPAGSLQRSIIFPSVQVDAIAMDFRFQLTILNDVPEGWGFRIENAYFTVRCSVMFAGTRLHLRDISEVDGTFHIR